MKFISIGHGNTVAVSRILAVISPDSAPAKRMVAEAKEEGRAIDVTTGRKTKSVLIADTGHIILCALQPDTVSARLNGAEDPSADEEDETSKNSTERD